MYEGTALSVVVADIDIYEVYWYFLEACTSVGCGRSPNGTITATLFVALVVQPVIFTPLVIGALIVCVLLAVAAILLFLCALKCWHHFVSKRRVKLSILSHDFSLEHTYAVSVMCMFCASDPYVYDLYIYLGICWYLYSVYIYYDRMHLLIRKLSI